MNMREFNTNEISRELLRILKEHGPLEHRAIVRELAPIFGVSLYESENKEKFDHTIRGQEQTLKNTGYIVHDNHRWFFNEDKACKTKELTQIVSEYSVLKIINDNLAKRLSKWRLKHICPSKPYKSIKYPIKKDGKKYHIGLLCKDNTDNLVVLEVDKNEEFVKNQIKIVEENFPDKTVSGIIIKQFQEESKLSKQTKKNSEIKTLYTKIDIEILKKEEKATYNDKFFDIQPKDEPALSDFLSQRLYKIDPSFHPDKRFNLREHDIKGGRIDIFCRDKDDNFVIIENKLNDSDYSVVGQILYYIQMVKEDAEKESKAIKPFIVMSNNNKESPNVVTVEVALKCCTEYNIKLRFYKMSICFLDD